MMRDLMVGITFYFLYLLEPIDDYKEKYSELSERVLKETESFNKIYGKKCKFSEENCSNPEKWCKLHIKIDDSDAEVKYYKERIIVKIDTKSDTECLNELFKEAKTKRDNFLKNGLVCLDSLQTNLKSQCGCIQSVFLYPLIHIEKDYKQADFDLEDEAITTFFYEIPDVGDRDKILVIFPYKYKTVLMRVSGPSIIATQMSPIMKAKLINLIYESALYKMRESERNNGFTPCKNVSGVNYEYLRNYIAQIFFSVESGASQIDVSSRFLILYYISAFGALAGIIAIIYITNIELLKTIMALILFFLTCFMLWIAIIFKK
jgi:hypothetical protein